MKPKFDCRKINLSRDCCLPPLTLFCLCAKEQGRTDKSACNILSEMRNMPRPYGERAIRPAGKRTKCVVFADRRVVQGPSDERSLRDHRKGQRERARLRQEQEAGTISRKMVADIRACEVTPPDRFPEAEDPHDSIAGVRL